MSRKKAVLKITLKSDLCVSSGYSFMGNIDSDVCYNENGIPYIPGRRLKGCLREAAEMIHMQNIEEIFGKGGDDRVRGVWIDNAYPEKFEQLNSELTEIKLSDSPYAQYLTQQKVLEYYTRITAHTQIEEETGTAKKNSLRYIRVVNQFLPNKEEPVYFLAKIEFDCNEEEIINAAKALRHIGLNRNRGLGNVECQIDEIKNMEQRKISDLLEETEESAESEKSTELKESAESEKSEQSEDVRLDYTIQNLQPLIMSNRYASQTEHYIRGQSILGALAKNYLDMKNTSGEDKIFQNIFLKGEAVFSDLFFSRPDDSSQERTYRKYIPAPLFINQLKKSKKYVNLAGKKDRIEGEEYQTAHGNTPRKLKTKFIHMAEENVIDVAEPVIDIVYHHSKKQVSANGEQGILYALEVIQEGQYFSGSIITKKKYAGLLKALMTEYPLRFGKSKSAQYGGCRVVWYQETPYHPDLYLKKGEKVLVALVSDSIFLTENGYCTRYKEVRKILAEDIGLNYAENESNRDNNNYGNEKKEEEHNYMQSKIISGYYNKWNLKKPAVSAVKAGSVFEYTVRSDCHIKKEFAGERNIEGFGQIAVFQKKNMKYILDLYKCSVYEKTPEESVQILEKILLDCIKNSMKERVFFIEPINITASALGRLTLMLEESLTKNKKNKEAAFYDFISRIDSFSGIEERNKIESFLRNCIYSHRNNMPVLDVNKMLGLKEELIKNSDSGVNAWQRIPQLMDSKVKALWGDYLMDILVYQNYLLRNEGE